MKKWLLLVFVLVLLITEGCSENLTTVIDQNKFYNRLMNAYKAENNYLGLDSNEQQNWVNGKVNLYKTIPVLMYHCIDNKVWGVPDLFVAPSEFEKQMEYLNRKGYTTITFSDLDHVKQISKPILITFDDGYKDNYTYAFPVLKKYHMKATIFLIVKLLGKTHHLNLNEISQMKGTIDFQSHTMTHPHLGKLKGRKLDYELGESKKELEKLLGTNIFVIAYPFGNYNSQTIEAAKKYYKYCLTVKSGFFIDTPIYDDYQINRFPVSRETTLDSFIQSIN
jgi:peptidoglycan/xylan/chitin deacetylase (PgdA/CDA1 family)